TAPPAGVGSKSGIVSKDGLLYAWAHNVRGSRRVTVMSPLTDDYMSEMIPNLGDVRLRESFDQAFTAAQRAPAGRFTSIRTDGQKLVMATRSTRSHMPEAWNSLDMTLPVPVPAILPLTRWEEPGKANEVFLIVR